MLPSDRMANDALKGNQKLVQGGLDPRADVERAQRPSHRKHIGLRDVVDEDKIARLLTVAIYNALLVQQNAPSKDADDPRFSVGVLPRSVDVGIPQDHGFQPRDAVEIPDVLLCTVLGLSLIHI